MVDGGIMGINLILDRLTNVRLGGRLGGRWKMYFLFYMVSLIIKLQ